ncbi:hypothetical protein niasHT_022794 [Heterodera trifolii]|uniref:Effector protein n=1 Tax=Heterodera trifolii TaxID=157864 RepID=A0ABD2JWQ9_9BILA
MAPFFLSLFPSICLYFSLLFPIEFATSTADQQKTNWEKFFTKFADELPPNERSADTLALFAEMDEADALLTDQLSKVIPPPPSPAHPTFQTLYLDKNKGPNSAEKNSAFQSDPKSAVVRRLKGGKWSNLRSLFPRTKFMKQTERIVKVYLKLKDNPGGGWGPLIQKMFGEMILAKKLGKCDGASLRTNCQLALELIGEGGGATKTMADQLAKAKPYSDFWTLTKRTTKAILCLLKGNGTKSDRQRSVEDILRMLKTFAEDGEALEMMQKGKRKTGDVAESAN